MSPPLRRGRALAKQRLAGVAFLVVLSSLVALTVALYQKAFTPVVMVQVQADRIGNQLTKGADVKARGLIVGEVRKVDSDGRKATLTLALDRDLVAQLPSDVKAQMIPKTLFGEKIVDLLVDDDSTARPLRDGDVVRQDDSTTARETGEALDNLLPLLQALQPQDLSTALNAVSGAVRGRGERIGENLELTDTYLAGLNPEVPQIGENLAGVADFSDTVVRTTPDLTAVLDNSSFLARSLVDQSGVLGTFLARTTESTRELQEFLTRNENRLVRLAADSLPSLQVYDRFSPEYPCLAKGLVAQSALAEDAFGGLQPGLHITLEFAPQQGGYLPGDEPFYGEESGPTCRGLPPNPVERPFPVDMEVTDGYCDEQEEAPGVQTECVREGGGAPTAASSVDAERRALSLVTGPVLGVPPSQVPDLAMLLFGPLARGTEVGLSPR